MKRNLGATTLRRRRRTVDPMAAYDALPPALRRWIAGAALPWSPASCRRVWMAARAKGASDTEALARLDRAERNMLARDQYSQIANLADHRTQTGAG
ncbi:DUF6525 family protein [Neptunicoccus cionae]|uniref:DUF6525 family protein n=1 Tax=Neptunicoccus cionae TaxID=2035344 RepID=UPI000C780FF3|nr:DUF6525 family protein [Amylibacter cionae]PLS21289.1 hypothetical protein C0U40_10820 [Amylibacter cionae]